MYCQCAVCMVNASPDADPVVPTGLCLLQLPCSMHNLFHLYTCGVAERYHCILPVV